MVLRKLLGIGCIASSILIGGLAANAEPAYEDPSFDDLDFDSVPLIANPSQRLKHRVDFGFSYLGSVRSLEKYVQHQGFIFDVEYGLNDVFALGLDFGFLHGGLDALVVGSRTADTIAVGVIDQLVQQCIEDVIDCSEINPNFPDERQITGLASLLLHWRPLYGKVNVVSELDIHLQFDIFAGVGVNGLREIRAVTDGTPVNFTDYRLENDGLFEGGLFENAVVHWTTGLGIRLFLSEKWTLDSDFRLISFQDRFEFTPGAGEQNYMSTRYLSRLGVGYRIF